MTPDRLAVEWGGSRPSAPTQPRLQASFWSRNGRRAADWLVAKWNIFLIGSRPQCNTNFTIGEELVLINWNERSLRAFVLRPLISGHHRPRHYQQIKRLSNRHFPAPMGMTPPKSFQVAIKAKRSAKSLRMCLFTYLISWMSLETKKREQMP
ncbi:hypothetical protein Ddc_16605 [Ditylenchus destructor]|nr:hypothetical protein Ddc_16605 [Ditylenchus destructor]